MIRNKKQYTGKDNVRLTFLRDTDDVSLMLILMLMILIMLMTVPPSLFSLVEEDQYRS